MIKEINTRNILKYVMPSIMTMLFLSFYAVVDGLFVSNIIGTDALSGLNIVWPLTTIVCGIGTMLGTGGSAVCATLLGEGKIDEAKEKFSLFSIVGGTLGILLTIIFALYLKEFLYFLGADETTYRYCYDYFFYLGMFAVWCIFQPFFQSALIASGKPGLAFLSMFVGGITNIVLDYVFMVDLNMGVSGSAIATGIGYLLSSLVAILYFIKPKGRESLAFVKPKMDYNAIGNVCFNGSSEMVASSSSAVITFMLNNIMNDIAGTDGVAAITVVLYIQFAINAIFYGYALGVAPVISYSYGEKNSDKLKCIFRISMKLIMVTSLVVTVLSVLFSKELIMIFSDNNINVFNMVSDGFKIFAISFIFTGINLYVSLMFTAYSNGKISAITSFLRTFVFIGLALLILPNMLDIVGVWLAVPIAEILSFIISIYCVLKYRKEYMY